MKKLIALIAALLLAISLVPHDASAATSTKSKSIKLDSYSFGDVVKSSTYTASGTFKIKMPDMGTYSFTDSIPVVIINLKKSNGTAVKTWTVSGYEKMGGGTYTLTGLPKGKYYVQVSGNIDQGAAKTWKFTSTFY